MFWALQAGVRWGGKDPGVHLVTLFLGLCLPDKPEAAPKGLWVPRERVEEGLGFLVVGPVAPGPRHRVRLPVLQTCGCGENE